MVMEFEFLPSTISCKRAGISCGHDPAMQDERVRTKHGCSLSSTRGLEDVDLAVVQQVVLLQQSDLLLSRHRVSTACCPRRRIHA